MHTFILVTTNDRLITFSLFVNIVKQMTIYTIPMMAPYIPYYYYLAVCSLGNNILFEGANAL